jgi:hypothetical protein
VFLLAVNALAIGWELVVKPLDLGIKPVLNQETKFRFSKTANVIIIILDTFQTDVFAQLIESDTALTEEFKDFTYFPDIVGCYWYTFPSIPCYLTGTYYDNSVDYREYLRQAYNENSLPLRLKRDGYYTDVYETPEGIPYDTSLFDSLTLAFLTPEIMHDLSLTLISGIYRTSPAFLKAMYRPQDLYYLAERFNVRHSYLNDYGFDLLAQDNFEDVRFTLDFLNFADPSADKPVFAYYHLVGIHPPLTMGEGFLKTEMFPERASFMTVAQNELALVQLMIYRLKEIGVYDSSVIVIAGDHGIRSPIEVNTTLSTAKHMVPNKLLTDTYQTPTQEAPGLPLFMIKPVGAKQPTLATSYTPLSMVDLSKVVLHSIKSPDLEDIPSQLSRRLYKFNSTEGEFTHSPPMIEYEVTGPSWFAESWRQTGVIYTWQNNR